MFDGSEVPALYRLEERGLVKAEWDLSDEGRRARFYRLTAAGKKRVPQEQHDWRRFAAAVEQVLAGS